MKSKRTRAPRQRCPTRIIPIDVFGSESVAADLLNVEFHDVLRMVSVQEDSDYEDYLEPVIVEGGGLPQEFGEVWTDGLTSHQVIDYDHQYVVHDDEYVSDEGIQTNQTECIWSVLQPWLAKFHGLSKQGMEQAALIYGALRSLNVNGAPIYGLIDCIAVNVFR